MSASAGTRAETEQALADYPVVKVMDRRPHLGLPTRTTTSQGLTDG